MGSLVFKKILGWCAHLVVSVLLLYFVVCPVYAGIAKVLEKLGATESVNDRISP